MGTRIRPRIPGNSAPGIEVFAPFLQILGDTAVQNVTRRLLTAQLDANDKAHATDDADEVLRSQ